MNTRYLTGLAFTGLLMATLFAFDASAKDEKIVSHRYFVKSEKSIWKKTFNARNSFKGGFSADLSTIQLNIAKFMGIETEQLPLYQISPLFNSSEDNADDIMPEALALESQNQDAKKRLIPDSQAPWNILFMDSQAKDSISSTSTAKEEGIRVAILDTGAQINHPDIKQRIVECRDFTALGFSMVDNRCNDKNGHGTAVVSVLSADGGFDGKGMYGVAPNSSAMVFKVCDDNGYCYADDIAVAIRNAVANDAKIISISFGSDVSNDSLIKDSINFALSKDVIIIAASGNDGPDKNSIDYPSALANVISVGAIDENMKVVSWSSRGSAPVIDEPKDGDLDFVAPGNKIQVASIDGGYSTISGTSLATPHLAGLASLILDLDSSLKPSDIYSIMQKSALDIDKKGPDANSGFGLPTFIK